MIPHKQTLILLLTGIVVGVLLSGSIILFILVVDHPLESRSTIYRCMINNEVLNDNPPPILKPQYYPNSTFPPNEKWQVTSQISNISSDGVIYRANNARTGVYNDTSDLKPTGKLLWKHPIWNYDEYTILIGSNSPVVTYGRIYFWGADNRFYVLNAKNGAYVWDFTGTPQFIGLTTVVDGIIYPGALKNTYNKTSYSSTPALHASNGSELWHYNNNTAYPIGIDDGVYYLLDKEDSIFYARDAKNGALLGTSSTNELMGHSSFGFAGLVQASPAIANRILYAGTVCSGHGPYGCKRGKMFAVNLSNGQMVWSFPKDTTIGSIYTSPAVSNRAVYFGSTDGHLYALNATTGIEQWRFHTNGKIQSSPAVSNGVVYFGSNDQNLYAVNTTTGIEQWRFHTNGKIQSSPSIANDSIYFGNDYGYLYALNATTGIKQWRFSTGGAIQSSPAIANGVIYFGSDDGYLYAIS